MNCLPTSFNSVKHYERHSPCLPQLPWTPGIWLPDCVCMLGCSSCYSKGEMQSCRDTGEKQQAANHAWLCSLCVLGLQFALGSVTASKGKGVPTQRWPVVSDSLGTDCGQWGGEMLPVWGSVARSDSLSEAEAHLHYHTQIQVYKWYSRMFLHCNCGTTRECKIFSLRKNLKLFCNIFLGYLWFVWSHCSWDWHAAASGLCIFLQQ